MTRPTAPLPDPDRWPDPGPDGKVALDLPEQVAVLALVMYVIEQLAGCDAAVQ